MRFVNQESEIGLFTFYWQQAHKRQPFKREIILPSLKQTERKSSLLKKPKANTARGKSELVVKSPISLHQINVKINQQNEFQQQLNKHKSNVDLSNKIGRTQNLRKIKNVFPYNGRKNRIKTQFEKNKKNSQENALYSFYKLKKHPQIKVVSTKIVSLKKLSSKEQQSPQRNETDKQQAHPHSFLKILSHRFKQTKKIIKIPNFKHHQIKVNDKILQLTLKSNYS